MDQPAPFWATLMRSDHYINTTFSKPSLAPGDHAESCGQHPGAAFWTAENGSNRDSSEAVQKAVRWHGFFRFAIRRSLLAAAFQDTSSATVFTNFCSRVSQSC